MYSFNFYFKKILLIFFFLIVFASCNNTQREYENNLSHFKHVIEAINMYFMDPTLEKIEISNYYTEDFIFHSYPAGYKKGIETFKGDYIESFNQMKNMNMSMQIGHSIYLPGIDENTYKINGSVRVYYGAILSIDTNHIEFSGYQTINFDEGKISEIWEWSDYGGVRSQLNEFLK